MGKKTEPTDRLQKCLEMAWAIQDEGRPPTQEEIDFFAETMNLIVGLLKPVVEAFVSTMTDFLNSSGFRDVLKLSEEWAASHKGHIPGVDTETHWANGQERLLTPEAYDRLTHSEKVEGLKANTVYHTAARGVVSRPLSPQAVANELAADEAEAEAKARKGGRITSIGVNLDSVIFPQHEPIAGGFTAEQAIGIIPAGRRGGKQSLRDIGRSGF